VLCLFAFPAKWRGRGELRGKRKKEVPNQKPEKSNALNKTLSKYAQIERARESLLILIKRPSIGGKTKVVSAAQISTNALG